MADADADADAQKKAEQDQSLFKPKEEPAPTSSSSPFTLTPEEQALIVKLRQAKEVTRDESPGKKHKTSPAEDAEWQNFLSHIAAKDIEFFDLDPNLQQELKSSSSSRDEF